MEEDGNTQDWATLRRWSDEQSSLLTRAQCLHAGLTEDFIAHRLQTGRWRRIHPGVYLTVPGRDDWFVRATAALMSAGRRPISPDEGHESAADRCLPPLVPVARDAALFGESAAHVWGLRKEPPRQIHIAIPAGRRVGAATGVVVTRRRNLETLVDEMVFPWRTHLPVTVIDLAAAGTEDAAIAAVARPVQQCRVTVDQLRVELDRRGRHPHGRLLREVLDEVEDGAESAAEVRYVRDVERAHGLPPAERQAPTHHGAARRHDNRYAAHRLVVEVDGRLGHESWQDRVRDGQRDRQVLPAEGVTLRVFWTDVAVTPCATAVEIGAALTAGGWTSRPRPCRRRGCAVGR